MSNVLDIIKTASADAALAVETAFGVTFVYYHNNDDPLTLYGSVGGIGGGPSTVLGVRSDNDTRPFWASAQGSFPPVDGPCTGDRIGYQDHIWTAVNISNADGDAKRFKFETNWTRGLSVQI